MVTKDKERETTIAISLCISVCAVYLKLMKDEQFFFCSLFAQCECENECIRVLFFHIQNCRVYWVKCIFIYDDNAVSFFDISFLPFLSISQLIHDCKVAETIASKTKHNKKLNKNSLNLYCVQFLLFDSLICFVRFYLFNLQVNTL